MKDNDLNTLKKATADDVNNLRRLINKWARTIDNSKEIDFSTYLELMSACHQLISDINNVTGLHNKLVKKEKEGAQ